MISPETDSELLAEIARNLDRIASALESFVNATVRGQNADSDGHLEIFATTHEG
jgi:hypothetical protein